jgi:hypothetical protein|tara:strand:+ start:378 stop:710 length:333 start_codon:yes stop_codon:yes gene_type:complete
MKFERTTVTISINKHTKEIFEKANIKKPIHLSMSTWIAVMIEEYLKTHNDNANILDFVEKDVTASMPIFFAPIQRWELKVRDMTNLEFTKLQERHTQLGNLINKEGEYRL